MAGNTKSGRIKKGKKPEKTPEKKTMKTPPAPKELTTRAKAYWRKIVKILMERGTWDAGDFFAIRRMSVLYDLWMNCEDHVRENGVSWRGKTDRGQEVVRESPQAKYMIAYNKELSSLEKRFGLDPLSRESIKQSGSGSTKPSVRDKYR